MKKTKYGRRFLEATRSLEQVMVGSDAEKLVLVMESNRQLFLLLNNVALALASRNAALKQMCRGVDMLQDVDKLADAKRLLGLGKQLKEGCDSHYKEEDAFCETYQQMTMGNILQAAGIAINDKVAAVSYFSKVGKALVTTIADNKN